MEYTIRKIKESEYVLLVDFLYKAIYNSKGVEAPFGFFELFNDFRNKKLSISCDTH